MIRVLIAAHANAELSALESAIRSSAVLALEGTVDPNHLPEHISADVLLIDAPDDPDPDWSALADLPIPVVLLLQPDAAPAINPVLDAGIRGILPWDATSVELEAAVQAVAAGLTVLAPSIRTGAFPDAAPDLAEPLSARELEVLDQLADGLSNKLIAHRLNISEHTVKTHVASIFTKLGASTRTEAVSQALRRGLILL